VGRPKDERNILKVANCFIERYIDDGFAGHFSKSKLSRDTGVNPKSLDWVLEFLVEKKFIVRRMFEDKEIFMLVT